MNAGQLLDILRRNSALLLDFDGPVCAVFAGYPAAAVADELRDLVKARTGEVPTGAHGVDDPLQILRVVGERNDAALTRTVAHALRNAEVTAVANARPTPGFDDVLDAIDDGGRVAVVVSNNSIQAVMSYLEWHDLQGRFGHVIARHDDMHPALLKPDPHLVRVALKALDLPPHRAALVGDTASDITAARAAGAASIGYANKPGKRERLVAAGANAIIETMNDLSQALHAAGRLE